MKAEEAKTLTGADSGSALRRCALENRMLIDGKLSTAIRQAV